MAVNLINRAPVPGVVGAPVDQGIQLTISTTTSIALGTVVIEIDGASVYTASSFQTGYTASTIISDGSGGWIVDIQPAVDLAYNSAITVSVECDEPGPVSFSQSYSFHTIRDIKMSVVASYSEAGDFMEFALYPFEGVKAVPALVTNSTVKVYKKSSVAGNNPIQVNSFSFENSRNQYALKDGFFARIFHPVTLSQDMTYEVSSVIDQYQAPNVGTLVASGDIVYEKNMKGPLNVSQPYPQGDKNKPRMEYEARPQQSFQVNQADYEKVNMVDSRDLPDVLLDLDFLKIDFINTLEGSFNYSGGGSRLLAAIDNPVEFIFQEKDENPPEIEGRILSEPQGVNYFPNSALLTSVSPFTVTATDTTVITESSIKSMLEDEVNQAYFIFEGTVIYDGNDRKVTVASPSISYTIGQDVLASFLARAQFRDATVTLTNFLFKVNFFNNSNVLVHSQSFNYSPFDFDSLTNFSLVEGLVLSGAVPGTATKVGFSVEINSFEACDRMELWMLGPSLQFTTVSTSRVVGAGVVSTRLADTISVQQAGNLNLTEGRISFSYVPEYDGLPPNHATFFDSRAAGTLFNGFYARHRTDGFVEFLSVDSAGAIQSVLSGSSLPLNYGEEVTFVFIWNSGTLTIQQDQTVIGTFVGVYSQPNAINSVLRIGAQINSQNFLLGEIHGFKVYSKAIG